AGRLADATEAAQTLQAAVRRSLRPAQLDAAPDALGGGLDMADVAAPAFAPAFAPVAAPDVMDRVAALAPLAQLTSLAPAFSAEDAARHRRLRATFWLAGATMGLLAAGAITYIVIRNRALARAEDDALVEISLDHLEQGPQTAPQPGEQPVTEAPAAQEPGFAPPPEFADDDADGALWVGDITTQSYMPLDTQRGAPMPAPNRRIYFATESQALAAGYHRAGATPAERE
ncbi:MAG: hypothetical protein ACRDID_10690, partial [Ktedonobacterales bacterium]